MYKVIKDFTDLKDNRHVYRVGDIYPRNSAEISIDAERYAELSSSRNRIGTPLIKEEVPDAKPIKTEPVGEVKETRKKTSRRKEK